MLMQRWSSQQGADSSPRRGDPTPRILHYQTGLAHHVNRLRKRPAITAINRSGPWDVARRQVSKLAGPAAMLPHMAES
jgi:hypothetical protein